MNSKQNQNNPSFMKRFLVIFIPLMIVMFLMHLAGITENLFMTVILSLAFVWMVQAIYKIVLKKQEERRNRKNWTVKKTPGSIKTYR